MFEIKDENEMFENLDEFIKNISRGGEVEFIYKEEKYSITHMSGMIIFIKIGDDSTIREFKNTDELIDYKIEGKKIKDIVTEIQPYFRCF